MTIPRIASEAGVFEPQDLDILQRVFDQVCRERECDPESLEGEAIAKTIIGLFRSGTQTERDLLVAIDLDRKSSEHG